MKQSEVEALLKGLAEELVALRADHDALRALVEGRNRSSATKRDMTDQDALAVLTGAFKDFNHKTAAEGLTLTYAQVYSCRFEYTFKHVHKELRDKGWKNPWSR
jgi:deoxyadenosine/deoxycytidine kinase